LPEVVFSGVNVVNACWAAIDLAIESLDLSAEGLLLLLHVSLNASVVGLQIVEEESVAASEALGEGSGGVHGDPCKC
jgi:hypothetical protein